MTETMSRAIPRPLVRGTVQLMGDTADEQMAGGDTLSLINSANRHTIMIAASVLASENAHFGSVAWCMQHSGWVYLGEGADSAIIAPSQEALDGYLTRMAIGSDLIIIGAGPNTRYVMSDDDNLLEMAYDGLGTVHTDGVTYFQGRTLTPDMPAFLAMRSISENEISTVEAENELPQGDALRLYRSPDNSPFRTVRRGSVDQGFYNDAQERDFFRAFMAMAYNEASETGAALLTVESGVLVMTGVSDFANDFPEDIMLEFTSGVLNYRVGDLAPGLRILTGEECAALPYIWVPDEGWTQNQSLYADGNTYIETSGVNLETYSDDTRIPQRSPGTADEALARLRTSDSVAADALRRRDTVFAHVSPVDDRTWGAQVEGRTLLGFNEHVNWVASTPPEVVSKVHYPCDCCHNLVHVIMWENGKSTVDKERSQCECVQYHWCPTTEKCRLHCECHDEERPEPIVSQRGRRAIQVGD